MITGAGGRLDKQCALLLAARGARIVVNDTGGSVTGDGSNVGAGHVARFFVGRTKGFYNRALSIEDVRDHLDEIRDEARYPVPGGPADEMGELFATIMASRPE